MREDFINLTAAQRQNPTQHPRRCLHRDSVLNELCMQLWSQFPLDGRGRDEGRRAGERVGKDVMQTRESLTDVAKTCVLRMVENGRGGGVEKERGIVCLQAHYSTLQCNPREREREHHDWLAESEQERRRVCLPTSNWVSTLLSPLHLISTANCTDSLEKADNRSGHAFWRKPYEVLLKDAAWKQKNSTPLLEFRGKVWEKNGVDECGSQSGARPNFRLALVVSNKLERPNSSLLGADISVESLSGAKAENGI